METATTTAQTTTANPDCHACHGTGWDTAFDCACILCLKARPTATKLTGPTRVVCENRGTNVVDAPAGTARAIEQIIEVGQLAEWLGTQTWSDFAMSLAAQYRRTGRLSDKQIASGSSMRAKCEAKNAENAAAVVAPAARIDEVTEGFYLVGDIAHKVQRSEAGNLYALPLNEATGKFEYARGAIFDVRASGVRMTLADAAAYGRRTGRCCVCGRELTKAASVAAGIGPICSGKIG